MRTGESWLYAFEFELHKMGLFFQQESPAQGWSHGFPYNSLRKTQMFSIRHQQHGWKWRRSAPIGRCLAHLLEYWALVCRALMMVAEMSWRSYRTKLEYLCKIIACRIVSPARWNIDDLCFYSGAFAKNSHWCRILKVDSNSYFICRTIWWVCWVAV